MTAIECRGLRVTLQGQRLLDDISLSVPAGQIAVLTGPSGSGKTTLLRTLNRLLDRDQAEVSGTLHLRVGGRMLAPYDRSTDPVWLRRRVGMVFQTPHLLPEAALDDILGHHHIGLVKVLVSAPGADSAGAVHHHFHIAAEPVHQVRVAQVALNEFGTALGQVLHRFRAAPVDPHRQALFQGKTGEATADETARPRYQNLHDCHPPAFLLCLRL